MTLAPCHRCRRHVRADAHDCPFCGASLAARVVPDRPAVAQRLSRSAMMALAASVVGVACGGNATPLYGAPAPVDGGTDASDAQSEAATDTGPEDTGGAVNLYGAPAPDASPDEGK